MIAVAQHRGFVRATALSNLFIDRFMPKANGEFVKVYIYLLRTAWADPEVASRACPRWQTPCSCTEGDILRALKYWENEKLVSLLYEGYQN